MSRRGVSALGVAVAAVALVCVPASAEEEVRAGDLAKQLSNPVADLASIPFQFNWENGVGENEDLRFVLNVQPVVPFRISADWNLIGRFITPIVNQPAGLVPGSGTAAGTGDIVASAFFSPNKPGLTWGVGPVLVLPTTTDPLLGAGKWSGGPTAVVLKQQGPWTYGALVNHLWSFADTGNLERADVSATFLQPFLAFTTPGAVTLSVNSESTRNWKAEDGEKWTVPINVSMSKVTKIGPFPFSVAAGGGVYAESPTGGPEWKLRTSFTLILPSPKK